MQERTSFPRHQVNPQPSQCHTGKGSFVTRLLVSHSPILMALAQNQPWIANSRILQDRRAPVRASRHDHLCCGVQDASLAVVHQNFDCVRHDRIPLAVGGRPQNPERRRAGHHVQVRPVLEGIVVRSAGICADVWKGGIAWRLCPGKGLSRRRVGLVCVSVELKRVHINGIFFFFNSHPRHALLHPPGHGSMERPRLA